MKKKVTKKQIINIDSVDLEIQAKSYSGCYISILKACKSQVDSMLGFHNKIFVYRFDIHFSKDASEEYVSNAIKDSEIISNFFRKLRKKLIRGLGLKKIIFKRMGYIWVRERHDVSKPHYHCVLILDGNLIRHPKSLTPELTKIATSLQLFVSPCPKPYKNIGRKCIDSYIDLMRRLSYLAKERGKERDKDANKRKVSANDYSSSRIKPNPNADWQGWSEQQSKLGKSGVITKYIEKNKLSQSD